MLISTALPGKAAAWPTPRWPGRSAPTAARCCCSRPRTCSGTALAGVGGGDGEDEQLPAAARGQLADVTRLGDAEADGRWAQHDGDDSDDDGRRHEGRREGGQDECLASRPPAGAMPRSPVHQAPGPTGILVRSLDVDSNYIDDSSQLACMHVST